MKISVLIATYNRKELLKKCLESLDAQTFRDFEVIIVDDGSTDVTDELGLENYYKLEHKGISAARNKSLDVMKGEYFFVMDSDDKLKPSCLEEHLKLAEETNADYVFPYLEYFGEGQNAGSIVQYKPQTFKECYQTKLIPHPGLYRTSTMGKFRYDTSLKSAVDYDYILNILSTFHEINLQVLKKPLYLYRINHKQERGSPAQIIAVGIIRSKYKHLL